MLQAQTHLFDIAPGARYMNGAAYSPTLKASNQAGLDAINLKAQNPFTLEPYHHFDIPDQLRTEFAKLINSESHNRVALMPAVSYGMATAAKNLHRLPGISEKKEIVIVHDDFPNNYFTFKKAAEQLGLTLRIVGPTEGSTNTGADWHEKIMEAVGPQTAILVATHVHWIKGIRFDLEALGKHCRENGALFVIDGSQACGIEPLDVQKVQPDAYFSAGYKWLLGVYGSSFGYYGPFFDNGEPIEESWMNRMESNEFSRLTRYVEEYRPEAQRYNTGEFSNFIHVYMMLAALKQLNEWGVDNIRAYSDSITAGPIEQLKEHGFSFELEPYRTNHLLGIGLPAGVNSEHLKAKLAEEKIYISIRGAGIRVSTHVYNTEEDWERLVVLLNSSSGG